ncbi:hypothetical protein NEUTE1DRAFT_118504 [Neurospora tetrasperma FGSC 2508]|uniref:Uncharacterized protein n=1 Tax=Neurospora tetrasperma (strain FGSC 2508 / ATCC MYA-4615 / P0657) TaxID=510951 RepID=F8N2X3_NEUT8|nr:uncharacterized protein NEUTE1DRAFT_118504 [Neurospora tetrasperma FGSC 2508]EGO51687.1 hypothetical protein NEUTE1DRAFT_118504 [Neurospora tetrasperma FGSC 2508]EGZ78313.1 hypothetical protein NEUTE2DRAFT_143159 [Neurospora tetrasperma FGSC 2509]
MYRRWVRSVSGCGWRGDHNYQCVVYEASMCRDCFVVNARADLKVGMGWWYNW